MHRGYIKEYRKITEWEWYTDINTCHLFRHCLYKANIEDKSWKGKMVKRGSFITSYKHLAFETGLSEQQVRTALNKLKSTGEITHETTSQYSIITVNNYELYQDSNKQINTQITNEQQTNNKRITTTKEYKNDNNDKNIYLVQENQKKLDPYTHPIVEKYIQAYKEVFNKRCYLDGRHRTKITELYSDIDNFEETLLTVFKRLKNINFDGIDFKPDNAWLLKEDNYIKVLEGSFGTKETEERYIYNANA